MGDLEVLARIFQLDEKRKTAYDTLLRHGPLKTSELGKRLGTARSDSYDILQGLVAAGLAREVLGAPPRYHATPIREAVDHARTAIEHELHELQAAQDSLLNEYPDERPPPESQGILHGRMECLVVFMRLVRDAKRELLIMRTGPQSFPESGIDYTLPLLEAAQRGVKVKIVTSAPPQNVRPSFDHPGRLRPPMEHSNIEIRHLLTSREACIVLRDDDEVIMWERTDRDTRIDAAGDIAFLSNIQGTVARHRALFDLAWNCVGPATPAA